VTGVFGKKKAANAARVSIQGQGMGEREVQRLSDVCPVRNVVEQIGRFGEVEVEEVG
jgi:hypothetical protein